MVRFEMIKYHAQAYPKDIPLRIEEVAAHFDITSTKSSMLQSLHTEYSYGKRALNSDILSKFPSLSNSQKDGVPQLWKSVQWAEDFAQFIFCLVGSKEPPAIIEIHPPFSDYTDINAFIDCYSTFEQIIISAYPKVQILIENRCGSIYRGGKFILSKQKDLLNLCQLIDKNKLRLKLAYDIPQIYTAHNAKKSETYVNLLEQAATLREFIGGVHLWGKKKSPTGRKIAHCGDLNSYFEYNEATKSAFLSAFARCFDDNIVRNLVLEVNSRHDDMLSILQDLKQISVQFI